MTLARKLILISASVVLTLVVSELVLQQFFGNLGLGQRFFYQPGDGRCVALLPNASVSYTGHWLKIPAVIQEVNAEGYRGPVRPRDSEGSRVALLGDSFTYGTGVRESETFAAHLRHSLAPTEVLNFGVPGLNLRDATNHYSVFAAQWHPSIVLFVIWFNDLDPSFCESVWAEMSTATGIRGLLNHSVLIRMFVVAKMHFGSQPPSRNDPERIAALGRELGLLRARAQERGARFGMVLLGSPVSRQALYELVARLDIPMLDVSEEASWPENRLARDTHLSPLGNQVVADRLDKWLRLEFPIQR